MNESGVVTLACLLLSKHAKHVTMKEPVTASPPSYWQLVAEKLRREPGLVFVALQNIVRWRAQRQSSPHRLDEWERLLRAAEESRAGFEQLLEILASAETQHERLREFSPFPGVLTREERRRASELCGYRH
jgi:hypothetical protein